MKRLIAITGMDGTGKSSLITSLCGQNASMKDVSIWDPMKSGLFQSKQDIDQYLCHLSPNARVQFLSHALTESLHMAMESKMEVLLLNAYYYKYFASELALGASPDLVSGLISTFPRPDRVIHLTIPIQIASTRKKKYSMYECGLNEPNQSSFIDFQLKVAPQWSFFDQTDWFHVSSELSKEEVFQLTTSKIYPV